MKMVLLSSKGQITIPRDIQIMLGVGHKSRLAIYLQDKMLIIKPMYSSIVAQTAGSLKNYISKEKLGQPFSKILAATKKEVARELIDKK